MKSFRLVAFLVFAVCAFCLPAVAQKFWTYKGEDGKGNEVTITISQRAKGYEVNGEIRKSKTTPGVAVEPSSDPCIISGSYLPAGQRVRATCENKDGVKKAVTGRKQVGKDALQITALGGTFVLKRVVDEPPTTDSSTENTGCNNFIGTWKTSFGTMTFSVSGSEIRAGYDFDGGSIVGKLSPDGRTLSGRYTEKEAQGTFRFTLSDDGQSFTGNWRRTSGRRNPPSGDWEGKCVSQ